MSSMVTRVHLGARAPGQAREALRPVLSNCPNPHAAARVRLLASELVTAAVRERRADPDGCVTVKAIAHSDLIRVEVSQVVPGFDPRVEPGERPDWGRMLLEQLADQWGLVEHPDAGEAGVWFETYLRPLEDVAVPEVRLP